jgi:hypothetical protein
MESKQISRYISFGTTLRYLQDVKQGWHVHGEGVVLVNLDAFFEYLGEFNLPVTQRAAYKLQELRDKLAASGSDHTLTDKEAFDIKEAITTLRETLFAEARGKVAFIVTDKRIDVNKLLADIPALMAPNAFDSLPDVAKYDFIEAGKCISFERPTAAAFHLLRGTEALLRHFYCLFVKKGRVDLLWGSMVTHLRSRRRPPPRPLLDNLDNIRYSFRNPTQHPEKIYDIEEVQDLFGLCIDVVNRMAVLIRK